MHRAVRWMLVVAVLVTCVGCDQLSKRAARMYLYGVPPVVYGGGLLRLEYIENPGVFLSAGASLPAPARFWLFTVLAGVVLLGMLAYALGTPKLGLAATLALSLIIGGGASNTLDRVVNDGAVVDYVSIGIGSVRTGVFNAADAAISCGVLLLVFGTRRRRPKF